MVQVASGEDEMLLTWFTNICGGTYLEMGGLDGVMFSNSYIFSKALGSKRVLTEASLRNYNKLVKNRPNEIANVHTGICSSRQDLHWIDNGKPATQGFLEFAAASFPTQFWTPQDIQKAEIVKCEPLKDVLLATVGSQFFLISFLWILKEPNYLPWHPWISTLLALELYSWKRMNIMK
jgi:hypothetical protein